LPPDSDDLSGFIAELAGPAGLSDSQQYWLRLAVDEITANIGMHGYHHGPGIAELRGRAWRGSGVCIQILDSAPPFDPRGYDRRERLAQPPGKREPGGFGLLLALARLDGFCYEYRSGHNCNVLIMLSGQQRGSPGNR
jgi:anti-sigma regulatory factor (Ser/Thr protein kinase)